MKERILCFLCREDIAKGDMTRWKDGKYYCCNCQIDLNRKLEYDKIIEKRKKELREQLDELENNLDNEVIE
jgi:uncharacterized Zn finger protein (UPF0148 family)